MTMKFNLMSKAAVGALAAAAAASGGDDDDQAGPAPAEGDEAPASDPATPAPSPSPSEQPSASTDVVAAADAAALVREAQAKATADANARMAAVFASDAGKANPQDAAFLLAHSTADAPTIIAQLAGKSPAAAAAAAAAPASIPNTNVSITTDPHALGGEKSQAAETKSVWDDAFATVDASNAPITQTDAAGNVIARIPRTGN